MIKSSKMPTLATQTLRITRSFDEDRFRTPREPAIFSSRQTVTNKSAGHPNSTIFSITPLLINGDSLGTLILGRQPRTERSCSACCCVAACRTFDVLVAAGGGYWLAGRAIAPSAGHYPHCSRDGRDGATPPPQPGQQGRSSGSLPPPSIVCSTAWKGPSTASASSQLMRAMNCGLRLR